MYVYNTYIDYVDTYHLLLCHENGNMGSLQLDVVSRKAVRKLEVYSDDIYLTWNGKPENLKIYNMDRFNSICLQEIYTKYDKNKKPAGSRFIVQLPIS